MMVYLAPLTKKDRPARRSRYLGGGTLSPKRLIHLSLYLSIYPSMYLSIYVAYISCFSFAGLLEGAGDLVSTCSWADYSTYNCGNLDKAR